MSKTPSSIIKAITVSVFTLLIVCFVCYRIGAFDNFSFDSASSEMQANLESNQNQMALDTPIVSKDSIVIEREIMPSSKVMMMPRPKKTDTIKKTTTAPPDTIKKKPLKKSNIMGSSKSAYIYEPEPANDTSKKQKK